METMEKNGEIVLDSQQPDTKFDFAAREIRLLLIYIKTIECVSHSPQANKMEIKNRNDLI